MKRHILFLCKVGGQEVLVRLGCGRVRGHPRDLAPTQGLLPEGGIPRVFSMQTCLRLACWPEPCSRFHGMTAVCLKKEGRGWGVSWDQAGTLQPRRSQRVGLPSGPRFATRERNALLLYNGRFNEKHDFIALEVVEGQVQLTFSAGRARRSGRHITAGVSAQSSCLLPAVPHPTLCPVGVARDAPSLCQLRASAGSGRRAWVPSSSGHCMLSGDGAADGGLCARSLTFK